MIDAMGYSLYPIGNAYARIPAIDGHFAGEGESPMMVNELADNELMLVSQVDHSRVAGQLAAAWGNDTFQGLSPYESMVLAAQEHDTGWWEWESKPTLNRDGYPLDYIGSAAYLRDRWFDFYREVVDRVAREDLYSAYMVSMHGDGLLTGGMGLVSSLPDLREDPDVASFVDEQVAYRAQLLPQLRRSPEFAPYATDAHIWMNYKYMEVFDQLGQFVCNRHPFDSDRRKSGPDNRLSGTPVPIRPGVPDTTLTIQVVDEDSAVVRPYPFATEPLVIAFTGRVVARKRYEDRAEFLREFYTARPAVVVHYLRSG
jgi:hypothetical protein